MASAVSLTVAAEPSDSDPCDAATTPAGPTPSGKETNPKTREGYLSRPSGSAQRFDSGLGTLLRHSHGTFSGLGLQPAVLFLLSENNKDGREPQDYEGTTVKSVEGVRNYWSIWKEKVRKLV